MDLLSLLYWGTALGAGLLGVIYVYFSVCYQYWKKRGIPYLKPTFPSGNMQELISSTSPFGVIYKKLYHKLSDHKFGGIYLFHKPVLLVNDPEAIKNCLVKDFSHFHDRGFLFDEHLDPLSTNLFQLNGERWKELRNKMSPTFTSGKMKMMFQTIVDCGLELQRHFENLAKRGQIIEVKDIMAKFTTDVIASCAFGIECNCLKNPDADFRKYGRKLVEPTVNQLVRNLLYLSVPKLAISLGIKNIPDTLTGFFLDVVNETVNFREKNNVKRNDFMQLLIQLKNKGTVEDTKGIQKEGMITMNEIAAQVFLFFLGGFETSSTTLAFTLYELALNRTLQNRLREEIDEVLKKHDGKITYESIQEMSYMDNVMSETLRKYPPAPFLFRECTKDYKVPESKVTIEQGTQMAIPIMGLHYDPKYFPDPNKYDPDRFNEEVKSQRHNYAYLPFGEGPRICIGMRFAQMQVKVGLASLLSKYEFLPCNKTLDTPVFEPKSIFLDLKGGTWLQVTERSH